MMKNIHSYWAYIVVALLIFTVVNAIIGFTKKKDFTDKEVRIGLFTLIVAHIQLLIGLGVYIAGNWYNFLSDMKNSDTRLLALEHPLIMILAIVMITIGWSKHKKQPNNAAKFKTFALFYGLALLLILSRIPWNNWFA